MIVLLIRITMDEQMLIIVNNDNSYNSNNGNNTIYLGSHETIGKRREHDGR